MKKRFLEHMFAIALVLGMILCGCGQTSGTGNGAGSDKAAGVMPDQQDGQQEGSKAAEYVQPEMKGEITIATVYDMEFLNIAAQNFMKEYPDVKVDIHVAVDDISTNYGGFGEYRNELNTKIMSGKAEDILFTTSIPIKKYMDMGVFEDLSGYLATTPQMDEEHYFMNVLKSAEDKNGHIYILPYECSFQILSFEGKIIGQITPPKTEGTIRFSEAAAFAKQCMDAAKVKNSYLTIIGPDGYIQKLVDEYWDTLIDEDAKTANINTEQYVNWLNEVKDLKSKGYFNPEGLNFYNTKYYFAMDTDFDQQAAFYNLYEDSDSETCMGMPIADEKGNVYTSSGQCLAINSASENKALAWEFIRYMLSEKIQSQPSLYGLAVNKDAFPTSAERCLKLYTDGTKSMVSSEEYQALLKKWINCINKCSIRDSMILNYFGEENEKFFDGKQTAEQTAQNIQNKVTQYLKE